MPTGLTEKQQRFVENYLSNGRKVCEAAKEAGYSDYESSGSRLLAQENIKSAIDSVIGEQEKQLARKQNITFEKKASKLWQIVKICVPDDLDYAEEPRQIDAKSAISAISELNKMAGHHAAEKHVNANFDVRTDADIRQAAEIMQKLIQQHETDH